MLKYVEGGGCVRYVEGGGCVKYVQMVCLKKCAAMCGMLYQGDSCTITRSAEAPIVTVISARFKNSL